MSTKPELKGRAARLARLIPGGARGGAARAPFVLLVVLLLGGGLIGLLVLNSALSEGAFRLDDLQRQNKSLTDEEQALQRDVDGYAAPDALQRRAQDLGMVPGGDPAFLNPDGTVKGVPSPAPGQPAARTTATAAPEVLTPLLVLAPSPGTNAVTGPLTPPAPSPAPSRTAPSAPAPSRPTPSAPPSTTPGR
ncbi:septum formation initiator family protein [Streptomyces sp. NPDC048664]|uniref:septum formation initiator family protein n=1 Tax=Streptomyces sp. NPDC048664 TaxID=3154505 RepID=UPI003444F4EA